MNICERLFVSLLYLSSFRWMLPWYSIKSSEQLDNILIKDKEHSEYCKIKDKKAFKKHWSIIKKASQKAFQFCSIREFIYSPYWAIWYTLGRKDKN